MIILFPSTFTLGKKMKNNFQKSYKIPSYYVQLLKVKIMSSENQKIYVSDMATLINYTSGKNFENVISQLKAAYLLNLTSKKSITGGFWLDVETPDFSKDRYGIISPKRSVQLRDMDYAITKTKSIAYICSTQDLLRILTPANFDRVFSDIESEFKNFVHEKESTRSVINKGWTFECVF